MTDPRHPNEISITNEQALNTLARAITYSQGEFSLILVRCNYATLRQRTMQQLRQQCPVEIRELELPPSSRTLYTAIQQELRNEQPAALMVFGLETNRDLSTVLTSTNQVREEFRKEFSFPLLLWINDTILKNLIKLVPDLESWSTVIEFEIPSPDLLELIQQVTDDVFAQVLAIGSGPFRGYDTLKLGTQSVELEFAQQDLRDQGVSLEPELAASLEFVLGRAIANSMQQSRQHYERSLALWQPDQNLERQGCVYFSLGVWWHTYAAQHRHEYEQACTQAIDYYRQALALFEQADRLDLVGGFINPLGYALQRLQRWDELEILAKKSLELNQTYSNLFRQARAYGFLAQVALAKSAWSAAKQSSETALQLSETASQAITEPLSAEQQVYLDWEKTFNRGWYLLSFGQAQRHLGQLPAAVQTLETAQAETRPDYDPHLYIEILRELRSVYFEQKNYLKAFETRLAYRSTEQQYGFRAFVGAGRLQPRRTVINPALVTVDEHASVSEEIAASGRQQDVNRLIERISRPDQKLTVLHGQSGVGKSSILQAGLVPALTPITLDTREVVAILQQVYTNWSERLGQELLEGLRNFQRLNLPKDLSSPLVILEQLRQSVSQNLMVVLIFDQFEEFFFVHKEPVERKSFYEFLKNCLNIPYVKVILSLREDYLHYLLECNDRLINLDVINNNILDKNVLFHLGNFTRQDARSVIRALTQNTPSPLEAELVDELVNDLSAELGEVRPIELQIVGAQLQTEEITTLQHYQEQGPKDALVGRFLEEVTKDCGPENEQIAKLVLYLLTDENNTRPLKTRADLELELSAVEKLDLILTILVKSGLVFRIPASPSDRYQLVHDYLVLFVRQKQSAQLIGELEKEREQRKLTEAKLNQALTKQLRTARKATYSLAALVIAIAGFSILASLAVVNTYLSSQNLAASKKSELDRLVASLKTGKQQETLSLATMPEFKLMTSIGLSEAVYGIREINRLEGHKGSITYVEFSPDNKLVATASEDKTAKVWNQNGALVATLKGHTDKVTHVSFSHDSKMLATASEDKTVKLWSLDGKLLKTFKGHTGGINYVSFSPNGKMLATASKDKTVKVWKIDGTLLKTEVHPAIVTIVRFSPDSKMLALASKDDIARLWSLNSKDSRTINNYGTVDLQFSSNGKFLTLVNKDKTVKLWSLNGALIRNVNHCCGVWIGTSLSPNSKLIAFVERYQAGTANLRRINYLSDSNFIYSNDDLGRLSGHSDIITHLNFSPDGKLLASASKDKTVRIWSLDHLSTDIFDPNKAEINNLQFKPDGQMIAVGYSGKVKLESRNHNLQKTLPTDGSILDFSPDGNAIITNSNHDVIQLRSLSGQNVVLRGHSGHIRSIRFSPDVALIASTGEDTTIKLWNRNGALLKTLAGHTKLVTEVAFSSNGKILASRGDDNVLNLWNRDGSLIKRLPGHYSRITNVQFSDNSEFIASIGDDNLVRLWRSNGDSVKILTGHNDRVSSIRFSPNSQVLASVSGSGPDSTIKLWRSTNGSLLQTIRSYNIQEVIFSPDSNTIATGGLSIDPLLGQSKIVQLWSLKGTLLATLEGHSDTISDVRFSPDGKTLATGSNDNTVKLWRLDGSLIRTLRGHNAEITNIRFSPNGRMLVSASSDNMVKLWSSDGKELKTLQQETETIDEDNFDQSNYIEFSADSKRIAFTKSGKDPKVKLWSSSGKELLNLRRSSHADNISISDDGQLVAIATQENALQLWGTDAKLLATFKGHVAPINAVSFNTQGSLLASASDDKTVRLWRRNGLLLKTLQHKHTVNSVNFSLKDDVLASASDDKTVKLWRSDGTLLKTLQHNGKVNSVSFSADGNVLASASDDKTVKLWRSDGTLLETLKHDDKVNTVVFSPNSKIFASASKDGIVKVWNSNDGKEVTVIKGLSNSQPILRFSPDSKILAIRDNAYSRKFKIYIIDSVWLENASISLNYPLSDLRFSPDGKTIAIATGSEVRYLSLALDNLLARGCNWIRNYLTNNPNVEQGDRRLCDGVGNKK